MITVTPATESDGPAWESYLESRSVSHHAYSWSWREIFREAFGHESYSLIARNTSPESPAEVSGDNTVCGVLPLYFMKSVLFGRSLISVPYLNAGGVVADDSTAEAALVQRATDLARELNAEYLELRQRSAVASIPADVPVRTHKVSMVLDLGANAEELFTSFSPKLRSQIRRPTKSGIFAEVSPESRSTPLSLDAFYSVFSRHMRDLGTPSYPRALFQATQRVFGTRCRVITIWHGKEPIAAGITIGFGSGVEIPWAAALRSHNRHSPNMLLYWQAMKTASGDGFKTFDFGRSSPGSGPYRFKEQWGPRPVPLHWYYPYVHTAVPDVNPNNPKYQKLVRCWQLLPVGVANVIGSWLTRSIP